MKKILLISLALCITSSIFAQFKPLAASDVFKEPERGISKIIQFKNGGTLFYVLDGKKGFEVKVYDAAHKLKAETHIDPSFGKLQGGVEAAFEINGDGVILITDVDDRTPILYRIIIDGKTGNLKEEKKIAELQKVKRSSGYAMLFGGVPMPDFFVRKDPNSENYAVALFNSFESDRSKRIELVHFGADHKEISRAYFASPEERYKYMEYIDMTVIGNQKVAVMVYAYNTASSGGKESQLLLANLDAGEKTVNVVELAFSSDLIVDGGICRYNPVTKQVILLAAAKEDRRKAKYTAFIAFVDPYQKKLVKNFDIYPTAANEKSIEVFGRRDKYVGMPQNMYINSDGTFSVVYEEITYYTHSSDRYTYTNSELGHVAISKFDKEGKDLGSFFVPKSHLINQATYRNFYVSARDGRGSYLGGGDQYKSFNYLNGKNKIFILFNDIKKNAEKSQDGKLTTIKGVSDCDAFYFDIDGSKVMPDRSFLFGKPEDKRDNNLAVFGISDYDPEKNIYATLELSKEDGKKGVKVVWLEPK